MAATNRRRSFAWQRFIVVAAGVYALAGGLITLTGWFADIQRLTDWENNGISMMPNAALCAVLTGSALLLTAGDRRKAAAVLGAIVGAIGAATLFQYFTGINLGIDTLLVYREWGQRGTVVPGRMGPPGSTSWTLVGLGLVLAALRDHSRLLSTFCALGVACISMLSLIGYLFGADALYTIPKLTTIALQTSTMLLSISVAMMASVPEFGIARLLAQADAGGVLLRRLLLPTLFVPILLGLLKVTGQKAGYYDPAFASALMVLTMIGCFFALMIVTARSLSQAGQVVADRARLLDLTADAILVRDHSNHILYWNRGAEDLYGYSASEALGHVTHELLKTVFPEPLVQIERTLTEKNLWQGELIHTRKDGSTRTVFSRWSIDPSPALGSRVLESNTDITARKRTESRLSVAHAVTAILASAETVESAVPGLLKTVCEGLSWDVGDMWIFDAQANSLRCLHVWHAPFERFQEFETISYATSFASGSSLPGRVWASVKPVAISDVGKDAEFARAQQASAAGLHAAFAFPIASGKKFLGVMEFFSTECRQPDQQLLAMFTGLGLQIGQFIERKRAEEALRESEQRLSMAQRVSRVGTFEWNIQTGVNIWSSEMEAMYGLQPGEFRHTQQAWEDLVYPEDRAAAADLVAEALRSGEPVEGEWRVTWPDGSVHWVAGRFQCIKDAKGSPLRLTGVNIDITDRKRAEEERARLLEREQSARAEAEHAGRMKDEFLATLSHELRNPLNAILGWVRLIDKNPTDQRMVNEGIQVISRNAKLQADLIADLLDMSRIVSGKIRLQIEEISLSDVITAAVDSVRLSAEAKGIRIELLVSEIPDLVRGDSGRLQQVVWNLLSNAIKFTPKGGRIQVVWAKKDSQAEISVNDTGAGIRPDFLPHVFERFRQADSSTTRAYGGLGLGLSIVKHLVEMHGGTVDATSAGEGHGATFTVRLPLALMHVPPDMELPHEERRQTAPSGVSDGVDLTGIKVLAIDDQEDARELLKRVLEACHARVITSASVDEALDALKEHRPHIVLCDIGLPDKDGYQFIKEIREQGDDTPALAVTAFARSEDRLRALRSGYQGHVSKPIEPAELVATVGVFVKEHIRGAGEN